MSFRPQSGSRKSAARQFSRSAHEKKVKEKKQRSSGNYAMEQVEVSPKEIVEKTIGSLNTLGTQIFALSPFSQYFDDWLVSLKQVVSEFESTIPLQVDEQFVKECSQILLDVEGALAEKRLQENNLSEEAKALAETNHLIVEVDKEYAESARERSFKRNSDVQRLSAKIRELEENLVNQQEVKISFYKLNSRRKAAQQLTQTQQDLKSTRNELQVTLENFTAEQEKMHDNYEKRKQELTEKSDSLHKELEKLETDTSTEPRQLSTNALAKAINNFVQRTPTCLEHAQ